MHEEERLQPPLARSLVFNEENEFVTGSNQTAFFGSLSGGVYTFTRNPDFGKTNSFNSLSVPRQYQVAVRLRY